MSGRFVVFEGGEGTGKSTQARLLAARWGALLTHEPGATELGRALRALVLDSALSIDARAEALVMAADRAQHVAEVIRPALASGRDVVSDRFSGSTLAYQGYARGLDVDELSAVSQWAAAGVEPDVVVLLHVPAEVAALRMDRRDLDRMESAGAEFHRRVVEGYLSLAAADPKRWRVVDGVGSVQEVEQRVHEALE